MSTKHIDPTPDNFKSYEDAEFKTVTFQSELRARHFEVKIDENVIKVLQTQAKEKGVRLSDLVSELLRQQLRMAA